MRGFAVIVMVIGHSLDSILNVGVRSTDLFGVYNAARGFTAPMFLFISGFAFIVATSKYWEEYRSFTLRLRKRLSKMGLLLVIGYALHFPFFSFSKILDATGPAELEHLLQVDVLQCLAVCILFMHLLIFILPSPRAFIATLASVAAVIVLASPIVWAYDFGPFLSHVVSPYLNQQQVSLFPIFPYGGFLYAGVVAGYFFRRAKADGRDREFFLRLTWGGAFAIVAAILIDRLPVSVYPMHDFWKTSPNFFLIRVGVIALIASFFFTIARHISGIPARQLVLLGQTSLLVYAIHLIVVYGSPVNRGLLQLIGQTLPLVQALMYAAGVLLAMLLLAHAWTYAKTHHELPLRLVQYGFASSLLYLFFTQPY